jgi:pyruvate,water dikinase
MLVGGKGVSLARLSAAELPVPGGFHVTTSAYERFISTNNLQPKILKALQSVDHTDPTSLDTASNAIRKMFLKADVPADISGAIAKAYVDLPGKVTVVAVRSSATAEDLPDLSFAGQQESFLNVHGVTAVQEAVKQCWASLWTARAIGYRAKNDIDQETVKLAVVVQMLVLAEASGIMFTANPITGQRDQSFINAAWGLGEAIVGGLVTPDTFIVDKSTGQILESEIADKHMMTVHLDAGTEEQPVPEEMRRSTVLSDSQAAKLMQLGTQIEALYEMPMDIEWTLLDGEFAIVQARPITTLPEPVPSAPTEWKLPDGAYVAMRNNIVELMADPLSPLFQTFGLNAVNTCMNDLLKSFFGGTSVLPGNPIISVNEYAYYNGSVKFGPMVKIILDTGGIMRRMFTGAVERWTEEGRPHYLQTVGMWKSRQWKELSSTELLAAGRELSEAAINAYLALVSGLIPAAWMSEAWFTLTYKLIKRRDDPTAPTYLLGFDSIPIQADKSLYDLADWARARPNLASYLDTTPTDQLVTELGNDQVPSGVDANEWREWQSRFQAHLDQFGHTIYNLDFVNSVPADDPAPLMETCKMYISGQGKNPHTRQKTSAEQREQATQSFQKRLKGMRLKLFNKNLERAQRYAPLREDGLADIGLSYPLLRQMLLELGRRIVEGGLIEKRDDVFWLKQDEVEQAASKLDRGETLGSLSEVIPQRKAIWRAANSVPPPVMLPNKILGMDIMKIRSGRGKKLSGDILKGVAASPGRVTAPARVLNGPEDFSQMQTGDVLVAAITTPAWTPLFARASAVVTDVGGPLSHGSIVAREYGIPAVLGTDSATKRIRSGDVITVDGTEGTIQLKDGE